MDKDTQDQIVEQPTEPVVIPPQQSAEDTSNWEDRPVTAPNGRLIIETFEGNDKGTVIMKDEL